MNLHCHRLSRALLLSAACVLLPHGGAAQAKASGSSAPNSSAIDIYAGYAYFHPVNSGIYQQFYLPIGSGVVGSVTGYFNHVFGIQAEAAKFPNYPGYCYATYEAGPVLRLKAGRFVPFAHLLGGAAQIGPAYQYGGSSNTCAWGWAANGGLGLDYVLPAAALHDHVALRLGEADYQYADANFGAANPPGSPTGGEAQIAAYRLSAGLVFRLGSISPPLPAAFGCEVQPASVYPGDPITVTGRVINLEESKKLLPVYSWSSTGGRIAGGAGGATIATGGMAAGDYIVRGQVSEGSAPSQHADCTTSFRVIAYQPPTISCSASPDNILPGGFSTIASVARSPQNRPLNYSYGATAGQITVTGTNATLSASDVRPGIINITCNVVDDTGNAASSATMVTVTAPPPPPVPPAPSAQKLCSLSFDRDKKRPVRVDNEAKGCLDDIGLALIRDSSAILVVVGKHDPGEKPEAAAERTLNVKQYLTDEKGINPNRIEVRTGENTGRGVDNVLVPAGATWDTGGTTSFDPSQIQRHGQPYAPAPAPKK